MTTTARLALRELGRAVLTVAITLGAVLPSLAMLLRPGGWEAGVLTSTCCVALAGAVLRWACRRLPWRAALGFVAGLLVTGCCLLVVGLPPSGRLGPLPGPTSPDAIRDAWERLVPAIQNDVAPVPAIAPIAACAVLLSCGVALLVDAACWGTVPNRRGGRSRHPALVLPLVIGIAPLASFLLATPLGPGPVLATVAAVVVLLAVPTRPPAEAANAAGRRPRAAGLAPAASRAARTARASRGSRGWAVPTVRVLVVVATLAAAATAGPIVVPDPASGTFPEGRRWIGTGAGSGVDPVLDLSRDLRSTVDRQVLSYTARAGSNVYLRTNVIDDLFDRTWRPTEAAMTPYREGTDLGLSGRGTEVLPAAEDMVGTGYSRRLLAVLGGTASEHRGTAVGIDAHDYASAWLPLPVGASSVWGLPASYVQPARNGTLRQVEGTAVRGGQYRVEVAATPRLSDLRESDSLRTLAEDVTSTVPDGEDQARIPDSIREAADQILTDSTTQLRRDVAGRPEPLDVAAALRDGLKYGAYTYSEQAPVGAGSDDAVQVVERFLRERSGYCVHFAAALALMARAEGIPSRIGIGYAPGVADDTGEVAGVKGTRYDVGSRSAHAWAELYFVGVGWVPFDATPGRGGTDADALTQRQTDDDGALSEEELQRRERLQAQQDTSSDSPESEDSQEATPTSSAAADADPETASDQEAPRRWWPTVLGTGAALVLLVLLALLGARSVPRLLRRRRDAAIRASGPDAAQLAWREAARTAGVRGAEVWRRPAPQAAADWFPAGPDPAGVDAAGGGPAVADAAGADVAGPDAAGPDTAAAAAAQRLAAAVDQERYAPSSDTTSSSASSSNTPASGTRDRTPSRSGEALLSDVELLRTAVRRRRPAARRHAHGGRPTREG